MKLSAVIPQKALEQHIAILGKTTEHVDPIETDKAYAAGFFDGEGNITIAAAQRAETSRGLIYNMRIGVTQNEIEPLIWLTSRWGGTIRLQSRRTSVGRPTFQWWCFSKQAALCLSDFLPFLQVKRTRAIIALDFQKMLFNPGARGHTVEYRERQVEYRSKLARLNSHKPLVQTSLGPIFSAEVCPITMLAMPLHFSTPLRLGQLT